MRFLKLWILLTTNLGACLAFCQNMQYNAATGQIANLSEAKSQKIIEEVRFNEPEGNNRIPYYKIKGSPFWKDSFLPAKIYTTNGQVYSSPIRLNLVTNEIHFLKNGEEMVLVDLNIDKIIFYPDKDSVLFLTNISNLIINNKKADDYVQVLNAGNYQLLKYIKRTVASADSLFRTQKRYFFADDINYFLRINEKIERIKRLTKDNIIMLLPSAFSYSAWIDENKIDFKKEYDVIRFLDHYNATHMLKEN
jgi:hypothetical protein